LRLITFLLVVAAAGLIFVLAPELDTGFSHLFYEEGRWFFLYNWWPVTFIYDSVPVITRATVALVVALTIIRLIGWPRRFQVRGSVIAYIALSLALGPGLFANVFLKDNMGRARPAQTVEFGGPHAFTPALVKSHACPRNCSFVSGHAALAFFLATFAFLLHPGRARNAAFAGAIAFGALVGLGRIVQGAHYLSDVIFAGFVSFATAWALHEWLVKRDRLSAPVQAAWRRMGTPTGRWITSLGAVVVMAALSYVYVDRPAADWFRGFGPDLHAFIKMVASLGLSTGWLIASFAAFAGLWVAARIMGGAPLGARFRAWSILPLFVFFSVGVSGLANNLMKMLFGRARPKLYFADGTYGFDWLHVRAEMLSFPSGHATTIVALMTALYFILPRRLFAFALIGGIIAFARAAQNAHFISDVLIGGYLAIMVTAWMQMVFQRSGLDLRVAAQGRWEPGAARPWADRLGLPRRLAAAIGRRQKAGETS
jgi:lipid A 4'-phosphatase